jgi:hypothetical protein
MNIRKAVAGAVLVGTALTGGAIGASFVSGVANAQTPTTATTTVDSSAAAPSTKPDHDPSKGGHVANGITEAVLTGDAATKATAAAQAAVPDGTIERVENDAEGAAYEAHVVKADGSHVTVKMDSSFAVTGIEAGR